MRKMKNSGIEWIGDIPKDWDVKKLKYLCKNITDGSHFSPETQLDGKTYITVTDVYDGVVHYESASKISERDFEVLEKNGCKPPIHSVLLAKDGTVGRTAIVEYNDYVVLSSLGILNPDENEVYYVFLKHLLDSQFLQEQMKLAMAGSALRRITIGKINKLITIVPPLPEQKRIADFLDAKCADIDQIRADIEKQIEILTDYKKSVITEAVTKGLDPKAKLKDSGIEWIDKIPEHWEIQKGKYVLKYLQKATREDDGVITCFRDGEVTLRSNRREDGFTISEKEIGYQGIDVGDLVVHGMDGFAGSIGISDSRGKASPVLNVLDSSQNKRYLMYYLRSMAYNNVFVALATGIRVRSCDLRWNKLAELPYPLPPITEQNQIADYIVVP